MTSRNKPCCCSTGGAAGPGLDATGLGADATGTAGIDVATGRRTRTQGTGLPWYIVVAGYSSTGIPAHPAVSSPYHSEISNALNWFSISLVPSVNFATGFGGPCPIVSTDTLPMIFSMGLVMSAAFNALPVFEYTSLIFISVPFPN